MMEYRKEINSLENGFTQIINGIQENGICLMIDKHIDNY